MTKKSSVVQTHKFFEKIPDPPKKLGRVARREWRRIAIELYRFGLLTKIDEVALSAYCTAYELWMEAYENVKSKGSIVKTAKGNIIQNPYLAVANRQQQEMRKWLTEFGMTPSSRAKVDYKIPKIETNKDKYFKE